MYTIDEIKGFEQQRGLLVQKLNALRAALILQTDASVIFKLEDEIRQLEIRKTELDKMLAEAYNLGTDSGKERLREKIKGLKISGSMGRLHLVNCNRQDVRDRFEQGFDEKQQMGAINHFYFLSACPTQLPPSLGERMVYEMLGELLDDNMGAVHCRFDPINHDRVKLEKLPIGYSAEKSKEMFREFCANWFGWDDKQAFSDAIAANRLPLARHKFSVLPLYLRKKEWKPFFTDYFDWIAEQLASRPAGGPTLLVFIIFYHENLHAKRDEKSTEILAAVDALCQKHSNSDHFYPLDPVHESDLIYKLYGTLQNKEHFYPLGSVHESDLVYWFNDLGEMNNARIQPVIDTLVESLPIEELQQFRQSQQLNMDRVELVQELVFDMYNK